MHKQKYKQVYPCTKCEYAATQASSLKKQIENKHQGARYPCSHCDHAATAAGWN